jgi:exonuclease III
MSTPGKRSRSTASGVSPPPLRRKRLPTSSVDTKPRSPSTSPDPPSRLRIFSWNVNGIEPFLQKPITSFFNPRASTNTGSGYSLRNFLRRHHWPHLLCLQEVKIAARDKSTQRALAKAANPAPAPQNDDQGPEYKAFYCLPRDKFNAKGFGGKVYGVATFIRADFLEIHGCMTRSVPWDLEGRVLITELLGEKLAVVNGYWVNGTENHYRDARTGEVTGTRHDRKREFHRLMLDECLRYEARGWKVCLIGDMNVARGPLDGFPGIRLGKEHVKNRADFNAKFFLEEEGLRAVDVWRHLYGERKGYTYYGRGVEWGSSCDRVDLVVVSRGLVEALAGKGGMGMGILETREERGHSDHVPLWVEFDLERLKGVPDDDG